MSTADGWYNDPMRCSADTILVEVSEQDSLLWEYIFSAEVSISFSTSRLEAKDLLFSQRQPPLGKDMETSAGASAGFDIQAHENTVNTSFPNASYGIVQNRIRETHFDCHAADSANRLFCL
jgi:hypothetical protein